MLVRWLERGLELRLVRDRAGEVLAFIGFVALERARPSDVQADVATRAARRAAVEAGVRRGEPVSLIRWWMCRDGYQTMSPENLVLGSLMMHKNFTPGLALSLWPVSDDADWVAGQAAAWRSIVDPLADHACGTRRHTVFGLDLRDRPTALFLAEITRRLLAGPSCEAGAETDTTMRAATLRQLIEGAVAPLAEAPRTRAQHAALVHTYLVPVAKQEVAAERVGVSFATYRRYLSAAIDVVTARLWEREHG